MVNNSCFLPNPTVPNSSTLHVALQVRSAAPSNTASLTPSLVATIKLAELSLDHATLCIVHTHHFQASLSGFFFSSQPLNMDASKGSSSANSLLIISGNAKSFTIQTLFLHRQRVARLLHQHIQRTPPVTQLS